MLLYAKQENEEVFHPLHLVPPTLVGLALAVSPDLLLLLLFEREGSFNIQRTNGHLPLPLFQIENKYKLEAKNIRNIYKRCKKGYVQFFCCVIYKHTN